jgi:hypothetical protein
METQQDKLDRIVNLRKLFTAKKWGDFIFGYSHVGDVEVQFINNESDFILYVYPSLEAAILGQQQELSYDIEKFFTGMECTPKEYLDELREVLSG